MTCERQNLGKRGEILAQEYLRRQQYVLLQTNYRTKAGEIDIIAKDRQIVVFVEVRTKTSAAYGPAYNSVTLTKQQQVKRVALGYIAEHNLVNTQFRFDVIGIILDPKTQQPQLDHLQNAF